MSYVQLSEGRFQVVYPLACGPGSPDLSKSCMDMARKNIYIYIYKPQQHHDQRPLSCSITTKRVSAVAPSVVIQHCMRCEHACWQSAQLFTLTFTWRWEGTEVVSIYIRDDGWVGYALYSMPRLGLP